MKIVLVRHGQTPANRLGALDTVRLRRARELLDGTSQDIQTISDVLGFAEVASFSRFFRRVAGVSPSIYRRNSKDVFMT